MNMAHYHILKIDSLLESLTLCNSSTGFKFQLPIAESINASKNDMVLGYVSSPINEFRYIFEVESTSSETIELIKKCEVSTGSKIDLSTIEELQPIAYLKDFINISEDTFQKIVSVFFNISTSFGTQQQKAAPVVPSTTVQTIYYGCPGTGKSREVKRLTSGINDEHTVTFEDGTTNIFRTTFHPDYDYATFVGCYKPVKIDNTLDYIFVPQVFTNAYVAAKKHTDTPIYLIIEEINRGNCAQIFGDLFQLLDRRNGVSEFPINAEEELKKYLRDVAHLDDYNKIYLPANLHIYATMNTSDQSLFPMDSAFKRRWEMKYVKIDYKKKEAGFTFNVNGKDYHWLEYLPDFNDKITEASDSEDKQMGEFFIRGNMTATEFKNKVMFYLWNDVCKDLYAGKNSPQSFFFRDINGNPFKFTQLFNEPEADATEEEQKDPYKNGDLLLEGFLYYIRYGKKKSPKQVNAPEPQPEENADTEAE